MSVTIQSQTPFVSIGDCFRVKAARIWHRYAVPDTRELRVAEIRFLSPVLNLAELDEHFALLKDLPQVVLTDLNPRAPEPSWTTAMSFGMFLLSRGVDFIGDLRNETQIRPIFDSGKLGILAPGVDINTALLDLRTLALIKTKG